jgi:hypothetical protein
VLAVERGPYDNSHADPQDGVGRKMMVKNLLSRLRKTPSPLTGGSSSVVLHIGKRARCAKAINTIMVPRFTSGTKSQLFHVVGVHINDKRWKQVPSFEHVSKSDRVFVLDPVAGELKFGNGLNGRKPDSHSGVTVGYRYGGKSVKRLKAVYAVDGKGRFHLIHLKTGKTIFQLTDDDDD